MLASLAREDTTLGTKYMLLLLNLEKYDLPVSLSIVKHITLFQGICLVIVLYKTGKFEIGKLGSSMVCFY